jgi:putative two-component system response regulator
MPGLSGVEVVPRALAADPDLAIVIVSAVNDASTAADVLSRGALDYVTKPVDLDDVAEVIVRALERRERAVEQRRTERLIRAEVALRTEELERRTEALEREQRALRALTVSVAETLVNAMEAKDVYLRGHSLRVADLGASIAEHLGLEPDTVEHIRLAGHLHDVGKIGIREDVLNKPGPLTPDEFAHVKDHVRIGMEILTPLRHLGPALAYVHDHHERHDGSGYPRGLRGDEITVGGRILAAADTFDALTSQRAYRQPMTAAEALAFLAPDAGSLFGHPVFEALRAVVERGSPLVFLAAHAAED